MSIGAELVFYGGYIGLLSVLAFGFGFWVGRNRR